MGAVSCAPDFSCTPEEGKFPVKPCCMKEDLSVGELAEAKTQQPGDPIDPNDEKNPAVVVEDMQERVGPKNGAGVPLENRPPVAFEAAPMEPWNYGGVIRTFDIVLQKSATQKFGVEVEVHSDQPKLRVRTLAAGIVEDWNKRNPSLKVLPGYFITKVNGYYGNAMKLIEALQTSPTLALTIEVQLEGDSAAGVGDDAEFPKPMIEGGAALAGVGQAAVQSVVQVKPQAIPDAAWLNDGTPDSPELVEELEAYPR